MDISYKWIFDCLQAKPEDFSANDLAERLTLAGAEVEGVRPVSAPTRLVAAKIIEVTPHPNSDQLQECRVEYGHGEKQAISGAPGLSEGSLVPFIPAGEIIPDGTKVEQRRIRGRTSEGMILSKEELQLEEKSSDIWNLDGLNLEPREDLTEFLEYDDYLLSFDITSNRPDLLSIVGIAREVATIFNLKLTPPSGLELAPGSGEFSIKIDNPEDTPRYSGLTMSKIRLNQSPLKIQHRLAKGGFRPKNNVVDATNYTMIELGHPLHPFDLDRLSSRSITIRRAEEGEVLTTIDDEKRILTTDNLVIADQEKPVALAGIMGGKQAEVKSFTNNIFLESASFDPSITRRSSQHLGLSTEASRRFERGTDAEITLQALARAAKLLRDQGAVGKITSLVDTYPKPQEQPTITLTPSRIQSVTGADISRNRTKEILASLDFSVESNSGKSLQVTPPSFRSDVSREIDAIEEVARIYGYDNIPSAVPKSGVVDLTTDQNEQHKKRAKQILVGLGLTETINSGFSPDKVLNRQKPGIPMSNPMGESRERLREELSSDLVARAQYNFNKGVDSVSIFELGHVFGETGKHEAYSEHQNLGGLLAGRRRQFRDGKTNYDFWDLKGILEELLNKLSIPDYEFLSQGPEFYHPTRQGIVSIEDRSLGHFGQLHPDQIDRLDFPDEVLLFEMNFDQLMSENEPAQTAETPSRYPAVKRDLSLLVPKDLPESQLRTKFEKQAIIEDIYLYDTYKGDQIPSDKVSLTYELTFRHPERTLGDEQVDSLIGQLKEELSKHEITLRK